MIIEYFPIAVCIFAILFVFYLVYKVNKASFAKDKAKEVADEIKKGAFAYLKRQYGTAGLITVFLFAILWLFVGFGVGIGFLLGVVLSAICCFFAVWVSTKASSKVAEGSKRGLAYSFELTFGGGLSIGLLIVALSLISVSLYYLFTRDILSMVALGFGTTYVSIFWRVAGGIFTKAADVATDIIGKIEEGISEDDLKNPVSIADQVGDNVGGAALAVGIFETYTVVLIASIILGSLIYSISLPFALLPMFLCSVAIVSSIIASFFVKLKQDPILVEGSALIKIEAVNQNIMGVMYKGLAISVILSAFAFYPVILSLMQSQNASVINLYGASLIGLIVAVGVVVASEFYTSKKYKPVMAIVKASESGHASNIIRGLAVGMQSATMPVVLIAFGTFFSFWLAGPYGVAIAAVCAVSISGIVVAISAFAPISDNAMGVVTMSEMPEESKSIVNSLDKVSNTAKAITKGYTATLAVFSALVLFLAFSQRVAYFVGYINSNDFSLDNPAVICGLLIGGLLPYLFASFLMGSVGKTAEKVIAEAKRQFKEIKGLATGEQKPEYEKCIKVAERSSKKEMIVPVLIPLLMPLIVGFTLGSQALGGMLIGAIVAGLFLAFSMTIGGTAWDSAKKAIEEGGYGGKHSLAHQAAVTGDAVGDPYKDTAGPAIGPMVQGLCIVALLITAFIV